MSYSSQFMKSGFIKPPLQNGLGRQINQLMRVTLKFCKSHGGSQGMRSFIESNLQNFAKTNEGVVVYVKPRRHRAPVIVGEYMNGDRRWMTVKNRTSEEIERWLNLITQQAGDTEPIRYRRNWHTDTPSIQGPWTPWTFKNPEELQAGYPDKELGKMLDQPETATEKLFRLYGKVDGDQKK